MLRKGCGIRRRYQGNSLMVGALMAGLGCGITLQSETYFELGRKTWVHGWLKT